MPVLYICGRGLDIAYPKIFLPEHNVIKIPSEVRNDIKVVNISLLDQIAKDPETLYKISPRQFEETVCELFENRGYSVKLTKQTRDGSELIREIQNISTLNKVPSEKRK